MNIEVLNLEENRRKWWLKNRLRYNKGLVISGFVAFVLFVVLASIVIAPNEQFEETILAIVFQGFAYFIMMCIANLFYTLGWIIDLLFNTSNSQRFRETLFLLGYWFSFALPILFVLGIVLRSLN